MRLRNGVLRGLGGLLAFLRLLGGWLGLSGRVLGHHPDAEPVFPAPRGFEASQEEIRLGRVAGIEDPRPADVDGLATGRLAKLHEEVADLREFVFVGPDKEAVPLEVGEGLEAGFLLLFLLVSEGEEEDATAAAGVVVLLLVLATRAGR